MSLASLTRWKWSTLTLALGSQERTADRNAALGSIATTRTRCRHQRGLLFSHVFTAAESRPSTTPTTWPLARSTNVVIHGSIRCQAPASSRYQRTVRNRCSSIPSHDTSRGRAASRVAWVAAAAAS
jgi:hypothetical protein